MPVVIDDAAAVAGFIGLSITLFAGCIKGFTLLSEAKGFGADVANVRCMLEVEQHRLNSWANTAGLLSDPPTLKIDVNDFLVAQNVLRQLDTLLTDVKKLRTEYKLDIEITDEDIKDLTPPDTAFGRLSLRQKPKFYDDAANVFQRRNKAWKRLKWVVVDVDRIRRLMTDIDYYNDRLEQFLQKSDRTKVISALDALLRSVVVNSTDEEELETIAQSKAGSIDGAVAATARLKQQSLLLGVLDIPSMIRSGSTNSPTSSVTFHRSSSMQQVNIVRSIPHTLKSLRLDFDLLTIAGGPSSLSRQLGRYDGKAVLVEWKSVAGDGSSKLKYRIERVSALLNELIDPSFHSLRCIGFLRDQAADLYGYVFELPHQLNLLEAARTRIGRSIPSPSPIHSLKTMLIDSTLRPSLNDRILWAISLTETILQLHTSSWLHKGVRSDNILFFNRENHQQSDDTAPPPLYLAGYEYARADNPLEVTENPESQFEIDLYRHPFSLGSPRVPYRKTFDLYSLGCVLLEMGLWSTLSTILSDQVEITRNLQSENFSQYSDILEGKKKLLSIDGSAPVRALVEGTAGKAYAEVVMNCLQADSVRDTGNNDDANEDSLEVQQRSLAHLRAINV